MCEDSCQVVRGGVHPANWRLLCWSHTFSFLFSLLHRSLVSHWASLHSNSVLFSLLMLFSENSPFAQNANFKLNNPYLWGVFCFFLVYFTSWWKGYLQGFHWLISYWVSVVSSAQAIAFQLEPFGQTWIHCHTSSSGKDAENLCLLPSHAIFPRPAATLSLRGDCGASFYFYFHFCKKCLT